MPWTSWLLSTGPPVEGSRKHCLTARSSAGEVRSIGPLGSAPFGDWTADPTAEKRDDASLPRNEMAMIARIGITKNSATTARTIFTAVAPPPDEGGGAAQGGAP